MKILPITHIITGNEYFRNKDYSPYSSGDWELNHLILRWTSIKYLIGPCWKNKRLCDLNSKDETYMQEPVFTDMYEFCEFDNEQEKQLVSMYSEKLMKSKFEKSYFLMKMW